MAPTFSMILLNSMVRVALPSMRAYFSLDMDVVAWIVTVYTLPYVIFMPLYGRLGDDLGRRRLLLLGMAVFVLGIGIDVFAPGMTWLMVGRAIQGVGAAGLVPLAMAILSDIFPKNERGKALGTWNSAGPITGMIAPLVGGLLVDHWGWRAIFLPALAIGIIAFVVVQQRVPSVRGNSDPSILRRFDWIGVGLLGGAIVAVLFFVTSDKITGAPALRDWRMFGAATLLFWMFVKWEKRRKDPFVDLSLYRHKLFGLASVGAGVRMFTMNGIGFLLPLYLVDTQGLSASFVGVLLMIHAGALLVTMRLGGQLADRRSSRLPVVSGLATQAAVMVYFAWLPGDYHLAWVVAGLVVHGLGAGLSLAALHRAALGQVAPEQMGIAAGLYSMSRFTGSSLGPALSGVLVQQALNRGLMPIAAYHTVFIVIAVVAGLGMLLMAKGLDE
jgi:EmrB/QacA subfamily drug resistance transporter